MELLTLLWLFQVNPMKCEPQTIRKSLNKAYLKVKPSRKLIEAFKANLLHLFLQMDGHESEEYHKNLISKFLSDTYYSGSYHINTKGRTDLAIRNGKEAGSSAGVLIETKNPGKSTEMPTRENLNSKALQELVLYYLRERITGKNLEVKHLIITNIHEWFIFDATDFDRVFAQNKGFVQQFQKFEAELLSGTKTDFFYRDIASPFIESCEQTLPFTYFDLHSYERSVKSNNSASDTKLIALCKVFSPEHLLKLPFANDSNSLDRKFYSELLHLIGLEETKDKGKKVIGRKPEGKRDAGSLLENAITILDHEDSLYDVKRSEFGFTKEEQLYHLGLDLVITWINRILFLKLLEGQLLQYHKGNPDYRFLQVEHIPTYDVLNKLFFHVLAVRASDRSPGVKEKYAHVPYLNSSLFEPSELERKTIKISNLDDAFEIPLLGTTVLKDAHGKKQSGKLNTLHYLFAFLDSYDFSSEGVEDIQEENKTLINASVLGLIFEKINGYKDGSFFTPGFITMYMCRETIRKAVVQRFNEQKNWSCKNLEDLYDKIEDKEEANAIINSLKICDPAVGSGHFLVSALNELIAIKHELKILCDRQGKRLKEYTLEVVNDELVVTDEDGELLDYRPHHTESQRVQETLFHEKQVLIENCLFGVDINPNSVKICRLRLWIELLKNAYYKPGTLELETLPNIDINIKCGNSLISRFGIQDSLKAALRQSRYSIDSYRVAVETYRHAQSKDEKHAMEHLMATIKNDFVTYIRRDSKLLKDVNKLKDELLRMTSAHLFDVEKTEKVAWKKKVDKLTKDIQKKEEALENVKNNVIYHNAFEWRFEFPEVLNADGDFVGFDVVIGNPPYVFGGNEGISNEEKIQYKKDYVTGKGKINLFTIFIEKAWHILKSKSEFAFIVPNTFLRVTSYDNSRRFTVNNFKINTIYDFGDKVFDDAVTTAIVITANKNQNQENYTINIKDSSKEKNITREVIESNNYVITLNSDPNILKLISKLKVHRKLGDLCKEMIFGVVITKNKDEIVSDYEQPGWKPFLEGKEINRYKINEVSQWLDYKPELIHRPRSKNIFEVKEKILIQRITGGSQPLKAAYDNKQSYNKESINNIILNDNSPVSIKYILALLNSKLLNWYYTNQFTNNSKLTVNLSKAYLSQLPICLPDDHAHDKIIMMVDDILESCKRGNEPLMQLTQVDQMIYSLYGLTEEEVGIIENS